MFCFVSEGPMFTVGICSPDPLAELRGPGGFVERLLIPPSDVLGLGSGGGALAGDGGLLKAEAMVEGER